MLEDIPDKHMNLTQQVLYFEMPDGNIYYETHPDEMESLVRLHKAINDRKQIWNHYVELDRCKLEKAENWRDSIEISTKSNKFLLILLRARSLKELYP